MIIRLFTIKCHRQFEHTKNDYIKSQQDETIHPADFFKLLLPLNYRCFSRKFKICL